MTTCVLCNQDRQFIFSISIPIDGVDGEYELKSICSQCWEIIAHIAQKANAAEIEKLQQQVSELQENVQALLDLHKPKNRKEKS